MKRKRISLWFFIVFLVLSFFSVLPIPIVKASPDETITYDSGTNVITAIGGNETHPIDFEDLWDADKAGTLTLEDRDGISGSDFDPILMDTFLRPADEKVLGGGGVPLSDFYITITNWVNMTSADILIYGNSRLGASQTYTESVTGNGNYSVTYEFLTASQSQVQNFVGTDSFDYEIIQGQWGVVWKQSDTQYAFDAKIVLGNGTVAGTTYFNDTNKQVTFNDNVLSASWQLLLGLKAYAHATFGELENLTEKTTSNGVSFIDLENSYSHYLVKATSVTQSTVYLYSCSVIGTVATTIITGVNLRLWNSILTSAHVSDASTSNIFNTIFSKGTWGVSYPSGTWDKVSIFEMTYTMYLRFTSTLKNLYARRNTYIFRAYHLVSDIYLINVDSDTWATNWYGTNTNEIYRQYEFDLTVTYPNGTAINGTQTGARVVIQHYGQGGAVDYNATLGEDGTISTQTLSRSFYNQTGGNSEYAYYPFNLQISNVTGYHTYSKNFTLNEKTDWEIALTVTVAQPSFSSGLLLGIVSALSIISILGLVIGVVVIKK